LRRRLREASNDSGSGDHDIGNDDNDDNDDDDDNDDNDNDDDDDDESDEDEDRKGKPFLVSLHIRRGDSCGDDYGHQSEATPIDSKAQTGNERLCYETKVYLDAIKRIRELVPKIRPIIVYLATDDVGHLVNEMTEDYRWRLRNTYGIVEWRYLDYSRDHFDYQASTIEAEENRFAQPMLGETAVADLWHLSHGHAFVGHMGSRFGKVSWLLAMARKNNFVPFFSVDGHSFCCEIDEACGAMRPYITVENCLSFGHEFLNIKNDKYWEEGSTARRGYSFEYKNWNIENKRRNARSVVTN
jgi:hypothetical protein